MSAQQPKSKPDQSKIVAPPGMRQRDFVAGWRACEADVVERGQYIAELEDAVERATALAERYGEAIAAISAALPHVTKARLVIAGLSRAAPDEEGHDA